jgi:hypothetical protein
MIRFASISALLLAPCYWQSRIQAGDLLSHIYNAWLVLEVRRGGLRGLAVTWQWTNVLFELMLTELLALVGPDLAQRIAASLAVLVFYWGALRFASAVCGSRPFVLHVSLAMLSYGWVFYTGLFGFYLSLGLCFHALALLWETPTLRSIATALPILAVAWLAHALPVVWAIAIFGVAQATGRLGARGRMAVLLVSLGLLAGTRYLLTKLLITAPEAKQWLYVTGADQLWTFRLSFFPLGIALLVLWVLLFLRSPSAKGFPIKLLSPEMVACLLTMIAVGLIPTRMALPAYRRPIALIAERMSLAVGVLVCALTGAARASSREKILVTTLALAYFAMIYRDTAQLNRLEDSMG